MKIIRWGPLKRPPNMQRERESALLAQRSITGGGAAPLMGAPAEEQEVGRETEAPGECTWPGDERNLAPIFAELRSTIWCRPWLDDIEADREAFDRACREVAPDVILTAARAWAAAIDD